MRFHHTGIACRDIPETLEFVQRTFDVIQTSKIIYDERQDADLCLLELDDGSHIELVSGKAVEKFISKRQPLYHTCWLVPDIEHAIENLYDNGAILFSPPTQAILFNNRKVAFLFSNIGIIELLEENPSAV